MNMANINVPADAIAEICKRYSASELSLFGSVLRDDFREDSDVDMLVVFKPETRIGFMGLSRMRRDLAVALGRSVDLVSKKGLHRVIRDEVLASARIIYAE
ncbi:MAG: nucleotidyltransferase domain-containing protein [Nitrospinae bacterium]|nr:nucleotidyltransferase domain-containing protein [Nitrospinota bacterium]